MHPSMFNVRVPLPERQEVFLMNTLSDAQLLVSPDVVSLLDSLEQSSSTPRTFTEEERDTLESLEEQGFIVADRSADRAALERFFHEFREDTETLSLTVLTTLQCNFACDYCFQGDHGDYNKHAHKMSLESAARLADWAEARLDAVKPKRFVLGFFGGEPLLNLPVIYYLSERLFAATQARGLKQAVTIITNGLLLTPEIVRRLNPFGLAGVKITLDGDRETHDRMRPLRGGQGTFDRIIRNIRAIAGECKIAIGGNFDLDTADRYPALLDFLQSESFADQLVKVSFKPVVRAPEPVAPARPANVIPLQLVSDAKPLGGTCMSSVGSATGARPHTSLSACDTCQFSDEKMALLREETKKRGFPTPDGLHMGPCELHKRHAYTVGPMGELYACPGFTGDATHSVGHISDPVQETRTAAEQRFDSIAGWKSCGDCAFIPVCGGGCAVASQTEQGDMYRPSCHKTGLEAALVSIAHETAACA